MPPLEILILFAYYSTTKMRRIKEERKKIGKMPIKIVTVTKFQKSVEIGKKMCYNN